MINTIRKVFNILKDMEAMSYDIMDLQDQVVALECDKAEGYDIDNSLLALEVRLDELDGEV